MIDKFAFINATDFRNVLAADYGELLKAFENNSWKSVLVLSGSIIEAVLIDYLISQDYKDKHAIDPLKMSLGEAIAACVKEKIIEGDVEKLATVVKNYRNLIHPGRVLRTEAKADTNAAKVATALVDMVLERISAKRSEVFGYTAQQIVAKIEKDHSSINILPHILKDMKKHEINNLITQVIPQKYFEIESELGEEWEYEYNKKTQAILERVYRTIYDNSDEVVKKKLAKEFVRVIKEEAELHVRKYGNAFFVVKDLQYLSENDLALVKEHIFSRLEEGIDDRILNIVDGIFSYLTKDEVIRVFDALARSVIMVEKTGDRCAKIISDAGPNVSGEIFRIVERRLDQWLASVKKRGSEKSLKNLEKITLLPF